MSDEIRDWIVRVYDKDDDVVYSWIIRDRTEKEAVDQAEADVSRLPKAADWSMVSTRQGSAIQAGMICIDWTVLGPRDVRVISVNHGMNFAVIQFRDLDKPPTSQNLYTVCLDRLWIKE